MDFTLAKMIREQARRQPDAPCLTFGADTLSFADLDRRSSRVAQALLALGVAAGDRVAVLAPNSTLYYEVAFGCSKVGAVLVGLNWRLTAAEIATIVTDAMPRVLFVGHEQRPLLPDGEQLDRTTVIDAADFGRWRDQAPSTDPECPVGADDVVLQLYTSGTTGEPKGAMLTNENLSYTARMAAENWEFSARSVQLVCTPLFHIGGIGTGMMALSQGGQVVLLSAPDPTQIVTAVERHRVTHAFFVPALIQAILGVDGVATADLSSLSLVIYGAAPMPEALLQQALGMLTCRFTHAYGMTETAGTVVTLPPGDHDPGGPRSALLRSCGRAVAWAEVSVVDPATGKEQPSGEVGEVWVRSGQNMKGYWAKPDETQRTLTADGWLRTGDAAYRDEEGYLYLYDRYKDMIISGGENIYPVEIENALCHHPAVAEAAVIGVPDDRWGETVKAVVVRRPGAEVTADEIVEFARTRIARYKCPRSVDFVDALPRNPSGKVLKKELRAPYWADRDRLIN